MAKRSLSQFFRSPPHNAQHDLLSVLDLEDGNVKAAIRLLMSADSPAEPSQKSLNALRDKHPPASSDLTDLQTPQSDQCLSVNNSEVRKAILSFPGFIWGT